MSRLSRVSAPRNVLAASAAALLAGAALTGTAQAADPAPSQPETIPAVPIEVSYLFTIDSSKLRVTPGKNGFGRVVVTLPASFTRFTDRPARDATRVSAEDVFTPFGWTPERDRLTGKAPNAALSVNGEASQVVELRTARILDNRIVLRVKSLEGDLERTKGPGSIFIDNADATAPSAQTTSYSLPVGLPNLTFTSTLVEPGPDDTTSTASIATTISVGTTTMAHTVFTPLAPTGTISPIDFTYSYAEPVPGAQCPYTLMISLEAQFSQGGAVLGGEVSGQPYLFFCDQFPRFTFKATVAEWTSSAD